MNQTPRHRSNHKLLLEEPLVQHVLTSGGSSYAAISNPSVNSPLMAAKVHADIMDSLVVRR
jgi:hypothetical protein